MATPPPPQTQLMPEAMAQTHAAAFELTRPWSAREFSELIESPSCFVVGTAQCFALARLIADEAELLTIATHPDHQRQGRAKTVMNTLHTQLQARGAAQVFLEVTAPNLAALALYESLGYHHVGSRKAYYTPTSGGETLDAIVMQRKLPF